VKFGLQAIFDRGDYLCPTHNLLGYEKDGKYGMKIEPEGAKTVRLIYDLFLAGYSQKEIAAILTNLSLPTAKGNVEWTATTVSGICAYSDQNRPAFAWDSASVRITFGHLAA